MRVLALWKPAPPLDHLANQIGSSRQFFAYEFVYDHLATSLDLQALRIRERTATAISIAARAVSTGLLSNLASTAVETPPELISYLRKNLTYH
jgi:hypothetical protein